MTVIFRDVFTGYSAPPSTGSAPFTATDNTVQRMYLDFEGTPTTGDKIEYKLTFPTGDVSFVAEWTSSTTLVLKRVSTIPGTSNGTATLQTFSSGSINQPRTDGDLVRLSITVNRGAVNALTAITFGWHGRSRSPNGSDSTTNTFNVDGELTPTAATFTITGSSFRNRPNIEGRAPDTVGGGSYSYQQSLGSFVQNGAMTVERFDINGVVAEGEMQPVRASNAPPLDVLYGAAGGISEMTMTARAGAIIASGEFPILNLAARVDIAAGSCLIAGFFAPDFVVIGSYTGGVYDGDYDSAAITAIDDDTEHLHEFVVDDSTQQAQYLVDGVVALTVDISVGAGSLLVAGTGGIGAWRSDRTPAGITITEFEIETGGGPVVDPCASIISAHDFLDPPLADIDGQATDTYPGLGTLVKHPDSAAVIGQAGSLGFVTGAGRAIYLDRNITGQVGGVETSRGDDYCAWLSAYYPERDSISLTTRTLIWEDSFDDIGTGPLEGRSHNGGTAGIGTYNQEFSGNPDVDGPGVVGDGAGRVRQPAGATGLVTNFSTYRISGLTLPTDYDIEIDVYNETQEGSQGTVGVRLRCEPGWAGNAYVWDVFQHQTVGPYRNSYHAHVGTQPVGALTTTSVIGPAGSTKEFETRIRGNDVKVYFGGDPYDADGVEEIEFFDGQFGTAQNPSGTDIGLDWVGLGAGDDNPLRIAAIRIFAYTSTFTPAFEAGSQETLVRYDPLTDSGYGARLTFDHTSGDQFWPTQTLSLFERTNGVETRLIPDIDVTDTFTGGHSHNWRIGLRVEGTLLVLYFVGGSTMATFDYATDLADETSALVTAHDTGDPGFAATDDGEAGQYVALAYFEVDAGSDAGIDPPCSTDPEGPHPYPTPPPPDDAEPVAGFWVMHNLEWRFIVVSMGGVLQDYVRPRKNLGDRHLTGVPSVRVNLQWQPLTERIINEAPTPGDPIFPPHYDPCEQLDPDDPDDLPPLGDIDPVPYAGGRKYGFYNFTPTLFDSRFNAAVVAGGSASTIMTMLAQAQSRGGGIVIGQGSRKRFLANGLWNRSLYFDWVDSYLPYSSAMSDYVDDGTLMWLQILDDWYVTGHFPSPNWADGKMPDSELAILAAYWNNKFPFLTLGLRRRPSAFSGPISGVLVYVMQYGGPGMIRKKVGDIISVSDYRGFRDQQIAKLVSWGPNYVGPLHLNLLGSGDGESGRIGYDGGNTYETSPAEIQRATEGWYGDGGGSHSERIIASTPWQYDTTFLNRPGVMDAIINDRNAVMALPPL